MRELLKNLQEAELLRPSLPAAGQGSARERLGVRRCCAALDGPAERSCRGVFAGRSEDRKRRGSGALVLPVLACLAFVFPTAGQENKFVSEGTAPVSFSRNIAPILQKKCVTCHGPEKAKGKFQLHTF